MISIGRMNLTGLRYLNQSPNYNWRFDCRRKTLYEGREITLVSGDTFGWAPHSLVSQLKSKESQINPVMTLGINGETRTVIWRRDPIAVEVKPLIQMVDPDDHDFYLLTLRFTEMSE